MALRLAIQDIKSATVLNAYVPTLQAEIGVKEAFCRNLYNLLQQVDSEDKLFILGDFNANVGRDFELWKGVLGRHGIQSISSPSPKPSSHHGGTHAPNTGTS